MSFDLEQFIEKVAEDRFHTKPEQDAFKDAFMKQASVYTFSKAISRNGLSEGTVKLLGGLGVSIASAAIAGGLYHASRTVSNSLLRSKFEAALAKVIAGNATVRSQPERARQYAETIFKFAPNVASDQNLLANILSNVIQGESVDTGTIKALVDLEGRYGENNSFRNFPKF